MSLVKLALYFVILDNAPLSFISFVVTSRDKKIQVKSPD